MKRSICILIASTLFFGCGPSIDTQTSFNIAGLYELIWYSNSTLSDDNPYGTIQATEVDGEHIDLLVKGQSGKVKISYSYSNVLVTTTGSSNPITYDLVYKKHSIGSARIDGTSRYVVLTPSSTLRIEGLDL